MKLLIEDLDQDGLPLDPPIHRQHLLATLSEFQNHREIGVGHAFEEDSLLHNYWAIHTAFEKTSDLFLTGVVFDDTNENGFYDLNEGLPGVTVAMHSGESAITNEAGGWSIPVNNGSYMITVSGGDYERTGLSTVVVHGDNIENKVLRNVRAPSENLNVENRFYIRSI